MTTKKKEKPKNHPLPEERERKMGIQEKEKLSELLNSDLARLRNDIMTAEARLKMEIEEEIRAEWKLDDVLAKRDKLARQLADTDRKICEWFGQEHVPNYDYRDNKTRNLRHSTNPSLFDAEVQKRMGQRNGAIVRMEEAVSDAKRQIYLADLGPRVQAIFDNVRSAAQAMALEAQEKAPAKRITSKKPRI